MLSSEEENSPSPEDQLVAACRQNDLRTMETLLESSLVDVNCYEEKTDMTPLHIAVCEKNTSAVRLLLSRGADANAVTRCFLQITPLQFAVERQITDIVEILLQHRADLTRANFKNETAMYIAANFCYDEEPRQTMLDIILRHGEQSEFVDDNSRDYYKLCGFIYRNDPEGAREFLKNLNDVDFDDLIEESPIYYAVRENNLEIARMLLEKGAKVDPRLKCVDSEPLLQMSLYRGFTDLAGLLVDHGAKVLYTEHYMSWLDRSPSYMATLFDERIFFKVVRNPDLKVDATDDYGCTILHRACRDEKLSNIKTLMQYYPDLLNVKNKDENSALHQASEYDSTGEIVEFLLSCDGIDLEAKNARGETALHRACVYSRNEKAVEAFLNFDQDFLAAKDHLGSGLLHWAAKNPYCSKPLRFLLSLNRLDVNVRNYFGNRPMHENKGSRYRFNDRSVILLHCKKSELMLKHGADPNAKNNSGRTPILSFKCYGPRDLFGVEHDCPVVAIFRKLYVLCGYQVNNRTLGDFPDDIYEDADEECIKRYEEELEVLKGWVLNSNPKKTLYDVLLMKRRQMTKYSGNRVLVKIYEDCGCDFITKFPYYGFLLNLQYRKGCKRKPLVDSAKEILDSMIGLEMPERWSENVLKHFSDSFLKEIVDENFEF